MLDEEAWARYRALMSERPELFRNTDPGGLWLLCDSAEVQAAEAETCRRYGEQGRPASWAAAGAFYEDPWIILLRDYVRFPDGTKGPYHRIVMRGGEDGIVVLPRYQGRIVLIRHFRNGLRDWAWELPRGGPEDGLSPEMLARRETAEEIGGRIRSIIPLGPIHNSTGMITETMHAVLAEMDELGEPNHGEGITGIKLVSAEELKQAILQSEITDAHTIHAFVLALWKGLL